MSDILMTKLYIPKARPNLVLRPRLTERLQEGIERKLTLVIAPAGFGKTTMISEWIPQSKHCVTWVSLDEADNDPARFWTYFIAALQMLNADIGKNALVLLQSPQPPPIQAILTSLLNEIASYSFSFAHVLDDYHVIQQPLIHAGINFILEHIPSNMHLIISSRIDPPLPLGRLRSRDQLNEFRSTDLGFSPEESAVFLNQSMGLNLSIEQVISLEERTEGWIAGLQIAAISMQGRDDIKGFIQGFSGSHRHILGYLAEEVLDQRPKGTLDFLLQTSILDRLCGSLCDAVTGNSDGQTILESLELSNLFITSLDDEGRWYRYHHLFAEVLRGRLRKTRPDPTPELHRRASEWYEQNGYTTEAVNHALAAEEWERAAWLIEKIVGKIVETVALTGQAQTLLRWLESLPDEMVRSRPKLCFYYGTVLMFTGQLNSAEAWLKSAENSIQPNMPADEVRAVLGWVALIRADIARVRGDLASGVTFARQALEILPETEALARAVAQMNVAHAYLVDGNVNQAAEKTAKEAIAPVRNIGNLFATLIAVTNFARLQALQGRCRQAEASFALAEDVSPGGGRVKELLNGASYYIGRGDLLREWNDLEEAHRQLKQGLELVRGVLSVDADVVTTGYVALAKLRQSSSDLPGGIALLDECAQLARERGYFTPVIARGEAVRAQLWLLGNNPAEAIHWAEKSGLHADDNDLPYLYEVGYLVLARVLIVQHQTEEALRLLRRLLPAAEVGGRMGRVIEMLVLQALALHARGMPAEAFAALDRALFLAEPEGYMRIFLDEGEPMRGLIADFQRLKKNQPNGSVSLMSYAEKLLAAFPGVSPTASHTRNPSKTLSGRERAVLNLIAEGASNAEIAQTLIIALSTVKRHTGNIYTKLGVNSRTQAIARARHLELLT